MKTTFKNFMLLLVLITGFFAEKSFAQSPSWQWAKSAGSTGSEMATGTALDASGNLYVVGWYTSANITFGAITLTNPGNFTSDIFLVKYDTNGNVIWAKTYGGVDGDLGNGITVDASGDVYITGWYTSATLAMDSHTLTNAGTGTSDAFVARINSAGIVVWAKSAGGTSADRGYGVAVDASGNVFATGGFGSATINFGTGNLTNTGSPTNDFFIAKYDASGNTLWAKSAGGTNADVGYSAATDTSGNVYITGAYSSLAINFGTGPLTNASAGTQDLFIVKYNGFGTAAWSVRSGGNQDDFGNAIAVHKNSCYVTGGFNSPSIAAGTTTLINSSGGTSDVILIKYDLNGNAAWAKKAGGADSEAGNGVAVDSVGKVYVTGFFISSSITFGTITVNDFSVGYRDLFIVSYDGNGSALWATEVGSTYDETANAIAVNTTGAEIYIGGTFNSGMVTFGAYNIYKGCGDDVFVAKLLGPMVDIKEEYLADQLTVYPNPTSGKFVLVGQGQIMFYNAFGEVVLNQKSDSNRFGLNEFDFSSQPKGVYVYRVYTDKKGVYTGRVVVQ